MPTFIALIEPTEIHYRVKLHQDMPGGSVQVIDNFLIKNY